jgi:rhodanese-related sulfurtransferase
MEVEPSQAREWLERGEAVLVDVRDGDEHAREHIEGSLINPVRFFNVSALPGPDTGRLILHCRTGIRSAEAAARAAVSGRSPVYTIKGGLKAWKNAGLPVVRTPGVPISVLRQMQLTVGTVVLTCSVLAMTVSPWFAGGAAFFGAGLVFAGASGTCGMMWFLERMPWNRGFRPQPCRKD